MEVDLLCAEARVAVELDGAQHLDDPAAYRRDRRKDRCSRRTAISCCASSPRTWQGPEPGPRHDLENADRNRKRCSPAAVAAGVWQSYPAAGPSAQLLEPQ